MATGEPADPHLVGVLDNYIVKRQILQRCACCLRVMRCVDGWECACKKGQQLCNCWWTKSLHFLASLGC